MQKLKLLVAVIVMGVLLVSCGLPPLPEHPREVKPFCENIYQINLEENPDFPNAFIGACIAYFQTGNTTAFVSLCRHEPIWEDIGVTSKAECMDYFKNYTE